MGPIWGGMKLDAIPAGYFLGGFPEQKSPLKFGLEAL